MRQRLIDADKIIRHIIESAPWDSHEAHLQLLKEARAYFRKHPTTLCLIEDTLIGPRGWKR